MEDTMDILMLTGVDTEECRQYFLEISTLTRKWANIGNLNCMFYIFFLVSNIWHAFNPKNFIIA